MPAETYPGTPQWLSKRILPSLFDTKKSGASCGLRLDVKSARPLNVPYFKCSAGSTVVGDKADTKRDRESCAFFELVHLINLMYANINEISVHFRSCLFVRTPFAQNTKEVDSGRPSGHSRRGLGAIGSVSCVACAQKLFFRREWRRRFPWFSF